MYSNGFSELFLKAEFEEGDLKKNKHMHPGYWQYLEREKKVDF